MMDAPFINTFISTVPLVTGFWLCLMSLIMTTKNIQSAIVFKFLPFLLGLCSLFVGLKLINWI